MTNSEDFPHWVELSAGVQFVLVSDVPRLIADAILRGRSDESDKERLERAAIELNWAERLDATIQERRIGVHNPMSLDRFDSPPDGDMLQRSKIRVPVLEAFLAEHAIGLRRLIPEETHEQRRQGLGVLDPIADAIARQQKRDSLTQEARRRALDEAGQRHVSAAPRPLSPVGPSSSEKQERKRSIIAVRGVSGVRHASTRSVAHAADWKLWSNIPQPEIWQAVALSLNWEPDYLEGADWQSADGDEFDDCPDEFKKRLLVATANARAGTLTNTPTGGDVARWLVRLDTFRLWAEGLPAPWKGFPAEFPCAKANAEPTAMRSAASLVSNSVEPTATQATSETAEQRCVRLLAEYRKEGGEEVRGALAKVAARDGRARQTVKADIDKAKKAEVANSGAFAAMARHVRK